MYILLSSLKTEESSHFGIKSELIELGAVTLMVPGNIPIGCSAAYLTSYETEDTDQYDPETGCLNWLNKFSEYHNDQLQKELSRIQALHPHTNIIYADIYNSSMRFYRNPSQYGFTGGALTACCGGGGPYNCNTSAECGHPSASACDDPSKKLQQKHGKKYHPLGGTIFNQLLNFNRLQHYLTDLAGKYKTYWLLSPFRNEIYTTDPANVECIHETNFNNYGKDLFMKSTLDSIFKVAFGVELDSMCASSEECKNFGKAFDDSSALIFWRYVDIFWQMKRFLNIGSEAALKKNIEVVDSFVYKLIHIKVQRMHDSENDSAMKKEDILSRFLQVSETSTKYLRDIILNFISVGKDTTATTLSWLIYMLCRHPSLQDKVAQEVKEATKMSEIDNFAEFAASMNEETLGKMQYLHAAITETIRLYPPLPVVRKKLTICISM
nr:cytochrome p450 [Quercus suber]